MAMGAHPGQILGMGLIAAGIVIGGLASLGVTRLISREF